MFYFFSKALLFLIDPLYWIFGCVLASWVTKRPRWKRRWRFIAVILTLILSNPFLFHSVCRSYEASPKNIEDRTFSYAVVLGGYGEFHEDSQRMELYRSADRLTVAAELFHKGIAESIVVSSGVSDDDHPDITEAYLSRKYLEHFGIESEYVIEEDRSWNTHENALYTSELLKEKEVKGPVLLISSAFHMRRASACFAKQGVRHETYPVDFITDSASWDFLSALTPDLRLLSEWSILLKEWVGLIVYKMKGYT